MKIQTLNVKLLFTRLRNCREKSSMAKKIRKNPITREEVLATGTRMESFVCPLCALNRPVTTKKGDRVKFDKVDLDEAIILQVRYAGGLSSGFPVSREESLIFEQIIESNEYNDIIRQIEEKCKEIIEKIEQRNTE